MSSKKKTFHPMIIVTMNTVLHVFTNVGVTAMKDALECNEKLNYSKRNQELRCVQVLWHDIFVAWLKFVDSMESQLESYKNN